MDIVGQINWLAVPVGGIISMIIGGIWYGPVAGKAWMGEMGLSEEELQALGSPVASMIKSFFTSMILTIGLAVMVAATGVASGDWLGGVQLGVTLGLLVVAAATFPNYAYEGRTVKHFLIHIGYTTIQMAAIGAMLAVWR